MNIGFFDMVKLVSKSIVFKYEQKKLTTKETAIVETKLGLVRGVKRRTVWNDEYFTFEKVPFAKPPVGELRFRAPVPVEPWTTVLDCTSVAEKPLQTTNLMEDQSMSFFKYTGSEDCLYLNVFTKNLNPEKLQPVMVWIYGGGFQVGEATRNLYSPDFFMSKDVVLVSIAYRLGPFGFLSLDDPEVNIPGNAGLKDQLLGLKWVKDHIAAFGGDPNNVTLFGESAGGASTHLCMISEKSKGLINKAIVMSGCAIAPWACAPRKNWAYRLAKELGYNGDENDSAIYKFVKNINGPKIVKAIGKVLSKEDKHNRVLFAFAPVVEPYVTDQCVIPRDPYELMKETWSNQIPMMIGGTSFEGLLFCSNAAKNPSLYDEKSSFKHVLPIEVDLTSESSDSFGMKLKTLYFGDEKSHSDDKFNFAELESDREFWHPMYRTVRSRIAAKSAPTYVYRFDYDSRDGNAVRNLCCGRSVQGVCHGDDLCYLFNSLISYRAPVDSEEYKVLQTMIDIWTTFASTSDPNCKSLNDESFNPETKIDDIKCLNITNQPKYIPLPELKKISVWNSFYSSDQL